MSLEGEQGERVKLLHYNEVEDFCSTFYILEYKEITSRYRKIDNRRDILLCLLTAGEHKTLHSHNAWVFSRTVIDAPDLIDKFPHVTRTHIDTIISSYLTEVYNPKAKDVEILILSFEPDTLPAFKNPTTMKWIADLPFNEYKLSNDILDLIFSRRIWTNKLSEVTKIFDDTASKNSCDFHPYFVAMIRNGHVPLGYDILDLAKKCKDDTRAIYVLYRRDTNVITQAGYYTMNYIINEETHCCVIT